MMWGDLRYPAWQVRRQEPAPQPVRLSRRAPAVRDGRGGRDGDDGVPGIGPCAMPPETLGAWLEGRLAAGDAAGVEAHLTGCVRCRWVVAQTVALRERPPDGE